MEYTYGKTFFRKNQQKWAILEKSSKAANH